MKYLVKSIPECTHQFGSFHISQRIGIHFLLRTGSGELWSDHLLSMTRGPYWPVGSLNEPRSTQLNNQTFQNTLLLRRMGWNFAIQLLANPFVIHDDTKKYARKPRITVNSNCSSKFTATSFSTLSPILEHTGTAANLYTVTRRSVLFFPFCSWTPTNLYTVSIQTASLSLFQMKMLFVKKKSGGFISFPFVGGAMKDYFRSWKKRKI